MNCFNYVNSACIYGRCPKCSHDYLTPYNKIAKCNECFYYNACDDCIFFKSIYCPHNKCIRKKDTVSYDR